MFKYASYPRKEAQPSFLTIVGGRIIICYNLLPCWKISLLEASTHLSLNKLTKMTFFEIVNTIHCPLLFERIKIWILFLLLCACQMLFRRSVLVWIQSPLHQCQMLNLNLQKRSLCFKYTCGIWHIVSLLFFDSKKYKCTPLFPVLFKIISKKKKILNTKVTVYNAINSYYQHRRSNMFTFLYL